MNQSEARKIVCNALRGQLEYDLDQRPEWMLGEVDGDAYGEADQRRIQEAAKAIMIEMARRAL